MIIILNSIYCKNVFKTTNVIMDNVLLTKIDKKKEIMVKMMRHVAWSSRVDYIHLATPAHTSLIKILGNN